MSELIHLIAREAYRICWSAELSSQSCAGTYYSSFIIIAAIVSIVPIVTCTPPSTLQNKHEQLHTHVRHLWQGSF